VFYVRKQVYNFVDNKFEISPAIYDLLKNTDKRIIVYKEKNEYSNPYFSTNFPLYYKLYSVIGQTSFLSLRYGTFIIETINNQKISESFKHPELLYIENYNSDLLKFLNAGYLISPVKLNTSNWILINDDSANGFVYKFNKPISQGYFYYKEVNVISISDASELLKNADKKTLDETIFTEKNCRTIVDTTGNGKIVSYSRPDYNNIKMVIETDADCLFLVSEVYDKNWEIKIDNTLTDFFPANVTFICFKVLKGRHTITLKHSLNFFIW